MRAVSQQSLNSEINVTPLVDVCLVLLIIFMVVLPAMVNGVDVNLPETANTAAADERMLPITIKEDGSVYVNTQVIHRTELPAALQRLRETSASRPVGVRADKRVAYGEVASVLAAVRAAGWSDVSLVTTPPPAEH
jgi:biopolymer transport protein TolR